MRIARLAAIAMALSISPMTAHANDWADRNRLTNWPENPADFNDPYFGFSLDELEYGKFAFIQVLAAVCLQKDDIAIAGSPGRFIEISRFLAEKAGEQLNTVRRSEIYDKIYLAFWHASTAEPDRMDNLLRQTCLQRMEGLERMWQSLSEPEKPE